MSNKLKHSDDYRDKIIKDGEKFKDKIYKQKSKLGNGKSINSEKSNKEILKKKREENQIRKNQSLKVNKDGGSEKPLSEENTKEVYDPLSKDLDNDGIIDRYDNDFRDSDYFESTYDTEDSIKLEHSRKKAKKKQTYYKRKNYKDRLYTRSKNTDKAKEVKANTGSMKKKGGDQNKKKKSKRSVDTEILENAAVLGIATSSENVRNYLGNGSDENVGVEAGEKLADANSKLTHSVKRFSDKRKARKTRKLSGKGGLKNKQNSKLNFKRKSKAKTNKDFQKKKALKTVIKRNQMKKSIKNHRAKKVKDKVKKSLVAVIKAVKNIVTSKAKVIIAGIIALLLLLVVIYQFAGTSIMAVLNSTSSVATTSYLSSETVLKGINNEFSSLEDDLQSEIDSVESNYPGYDEYIINKEGDIGHNVHELLSYITSRYGEVKNVSEVRNELNNMFHTMYQIEYKEEVETRYRTVTETSIDEDGNEVTTTSEESYEYKKLIVNLHKRQMDSIIRGAFADYPDNFKHYESLFLAQGNMAESFGNTALILSNGGIGGGKEYETSDEVQKKIVNAAYLTPSPGSGWCAMWVSQVYQNAGLGYVGGNACDMYRNYTFTSDRSKLKVGMLVAVESSSSGSTDGAIYGHVGIYIGDGKVIDNIGRIRVTTLDDWIASFCKHHPVGFGFPPSVQD